MLYSSEGYEGGVALGGEPMGGAIGPAAIAGRQAYQRAIAILKAKYPSMPVRKSWAALKAETGMTKAVDLLAHLEGASAPSARSAAAKRAVASRCRDPKGRFMKCPHCGGAWYDDLWSGVKQGVGLAAQAAPLAMALL